MPRLVNGARNVKQKPEYAGKLLIFCEGSTEFNYLNYFKKYLEKNLHHDYSDIVIEPINTKGDSMHVLNYAEEFLSNEKNAKKYMYYEKHLVFDCDAPKNIQEVINLMLKSDNDYILDYSNLLFETWLVMHFQNLQPDGKNSKKAILEALRNHLNIIKYTSKIKANPGTIGQILGSDGNIKIRSAIENAKELDLYWKKHGKELNKDICSMNPSVEIYKLIERLMDEIEYLCN